MKPIKTQHSNGVLKGSGDVIDLPITGLNYYGRPAIESCWQLSEEELEVVKQTGKIYFVCMGHTHPPIFLDVKSQLDK